MDDAPLVALGVLSSVASFGRCQRAEAAQTCRGGRTAHDAAWRRQRLRAEHRRSGAVHTVALRFLLAGGDPHAAIEPYMTAPSTRALAAAREEAAREGDLEFLPLHEDQLGGCSLKYVLWLERATALHPRADFIAIADDDVYIQFDHFEADLRRDSARARTEPILWGFIFWRPFYNRVTLEAADWGASWETHDAAVSKVRYKIERCGWELRRGANECTEGHTLPRSVVRMISRGEISPLPPLPMPNGPLFAVSAPLAALLTGPSAPPRLWLADFKRTALVDAARARMRIPYRTIKDVGCWPHGDATFGVWLMSLAQQGVNLTLIDTPNFVSHHPYPSTVSGAFSNSSIVLHGLKDNRTARFWRFAQRRSAGTYEPPPRTCDNCAKHGWVTWPRSPVQRWTCCGKRVRRKPVSRWPRSVRAGMNLSSWWRRVGRTLQ